MLLRRRSMMSGGAASLEGKLAGLEVGTIINISGIGNFIVVHQGNPDDSIYDASCEGTWLLAQGQLGLSGLNVRFGANGNYANSTAASRLESNFISAFSETVLENVLTVKIPYYYNGVLHKLSDGFECQAFLPATIEFGCSPDYDSDVPEDGATLDYFVGTNPGTGGSNTDAKREYDGDTFHWYRSPEASSTSRVWCNSTGGAATGRGVSYAYDLRPCIIMNNMTPVEGEITVVE